MIKILETHGAKHPVRIFGFGVLIVSLLLISFFLLIIIVRLQMAPMHVKTPREVPEYEINPSELDFTQSKEITKVKKKHCLLCLLLNVVGQLPVY